MKVTASVTRSGDWWAISVSEVAGVFTQTRRLEQVSTVTADAVAAMTGVDPADVEVTVDLHGSAEDQVERGS